MDWNINKLIVLFVFTICVLSVHCQNEESFQSYDLVESIKNSAETIKLLKDLKLLSEEDRTFLNAIQDLPPKSIPRILQDWLSETASDKCDQDLRYVFKKLIPPTEWSLKMVDSYGKPESGILLGNTKWLGSYDECVNVYAPPGVNENEGDFHGKYCSVQIPLNLGKVSVAITIGVCLPDTCSPNATFDGRFKSSKTNFNMTDLNEKVEWQDFFAELSEMLLSNATITCQSISKELTTGFIVVVSLLSFIAFFAVLGSLITVLEYYLKKTATKEIKTFHNLFLNGDVERASNDNSVLNSSSNEVILPVWLEKCKPFFNCFCIFTNGEKILNTASAEGQLPCLHGIKFLSMTWVILCHGYMGTASNVKNPLDSVKVIDTWPFQVVLNGFFSVDSFFVVSGFLVGYLYFQQASKTDGKIPWLYFYIHRYIRLTPVYMIVLAFYTTVSPYLGSGPLWPEYNVVQACKDNWWQNMLYINNFQTQNNECMGWSWYLANDMQFYIISPLFLITLYKWPKIGYSLLGLFFCITITANFALTYEYNLVAGMGNIVEYAKDLQTYLPRLMDFFNIIYIKPYTRIGPYLVGLLVAYIIHKRKQKNSAKLSTINLGIGWMIASGVALACQFGLYHQKLTLVETSFYNSLSRIGFSLGLGWLIFVCVIEQGDVVNSILSWKVLIPLSRLTYCAYLVHPIVQTTYFLSMKTLIEFNHINVIMLYLGTLFISYSAAFVTSLLFESPVIRLERLLRNKLSS